MPHLAVFLISILISLFVTGCVQTQKDVVEKPKKIIPVSIERTERLEKNNEEYSFLEKLPPDRLKQYNLFSNDKNTSHLKNFTPEQMLLVYFQSVIKDDVEGIYAITYGAENQSFDVFQSNYNNNLSQRNYELALRYRYYDSIESQKVNDMQTVIMKVSIGSFADSVVFDVKLEKAIWKLNIPPIKE